MKMNKLVKALAIAVTSFGIATNAAAEERSYILATASTGGTYYPVGVALATLSKVKLAPKHHFSLSAISSAGSGENVKLLNENEAQFAILQGLYGAWLGRGKVLTRKAVAKKSCVQSQCYGKTLNTSLFVAI